MITHAMVGRLLVAVAVAAIIGAVLYGVYSHGVSTTNAAWQSKWDKQALELSEAKTKAERIQRDEEQRRQAAIDEVREDAREQIEQAGAAAAIAHAAADSLREHAQRLAARASQASCSAEATAGGQADAGASMVLADVLERADARAGELAAAYDRARAAGAACERAYDALMHDGAQ